MKAIFARNIEDYLKEMNGTDFIVSVVPLFWVNIFPLTEEATNTIYELSWDKARLYPTVCFSFFP